MNTVENMHDIETHDFLTSTEYIAIDHLGITALGECWRPIEEGDIETHGRIPVNASGGSISVGHPVGATDVGMILHSYKQVAGHAGDFQRETAHNVATLNIGGSATITVSFIVGR